MKQLLIALLALSLIGCPKGGAPIPISDTLITASVAAGTGAGLRLGIKDTGKQKVVAQYLNTYAGALRTITNNPTPDQLTQQLMAFVPSGVEIQYPEISSFAVPMIVSFYDWAHGKYGNDTKQLYQVLSDVATGIETGSAPFLK